MIGVGTDIVAVARLVRLLERHRTRFLARCFRPAEAAEAARRGAGEAAALAARWAAKEAFLKALGLPLAALPLRDVEVVSDGAAAPRLRLHGAAAAALAAAGGRRLHLSLSHEKEYAVALVLVEG